MSMEIRCHCNIGSREERFPQLKEGETATVSDAIGEAMIEAGLATALPPKAKPREESKPKTMKPVETPAPPPASTKE